MPRKTILIVDDEQFIRMTLKRIFDEENYEVIMVDNGSDALTTIKQRSIDLALLDLNLPDIHGLEVLKQLKAQQPDLLVIVATGYASVESAIEAIKLGAYDYIKKPFKADAIKLITRLALETQSLKEEVKQLQQDRPQLGSINNLTGSSSQIQQVKHQIEEFSKVNSDTVLIVGESGSGKELIAQALHTGSSRANNHFVEINCASIPPTLLESELFGYEKGAFTDAKERKIGLIENAAGGTLFLDEIGEMDTQLQASLLRVIENKKVRRLGATEEMQVDVRIIAATNRNLKDAIEQNRFRADLYYRLNVLLIDVPPLRERKEDIKQLAEFFIAHFNSRFSKQIKAFSGDAMAILQNYSWPGNVRELKNTVERICILHNEEIIAAHHLPEDLLTGSTSGGEPEDENELEPDSLDFERVIKETEIQLLTKALEQCDGNSSKAARLLGIPRETFRYKVSKYKLTIGEN